MSIDVMRPRNDLMSYEKRFVLLFFFFPFLPMAFGNRRKVRVWKQTHSYFPAFVFFRQLALHPKKFTRRQGQDMRTGGRGNGIQD